MNSDQDDAIIILDSPPNLTQNQFRHQPNNNQTHETHDSSQVQGRRDCRTDLTFNFAVTQAAPMQQRQRLLGTMPIMAHQPARRRQGHARDAPIELDDDDDDDEDEVTVLSAPVTRLAGLKRRRVVMMGTDWSAPTFQHPWPRPPDGNPGGVERQHAAMGTGAGRSEDDVIIIDDAKPAATTASAATAATVGFEPGPAINVEDLPYVSASHINTNSKSGSSTTTTTSTTSTGRHKSNENSTSDVQCLEVKMSPQQNAIQQIQEIFPLMDPNHIISNLIEPITPQSIESLIQHFISQKSYPKIQIPTTKREEEKKELDYDNDEYERSPLYKNHAFILLINAFPFMGKNGLLCLLEHYNGRYYKTYMHIIDLIKKNTEGSNAEKYDEYLRLMAGGRMKEEARAKFFLKKDGIKHELTLKRPKRNRSAVVMITDKVLLDEINFTKNKMREWGKIVQKEKQRLVARKKAQETGTAVDCTCCYGDYALEEMSSCNDGHLFCLDCLRRYVEEKVFGTGDLGEKGCTELRCMDMSGCQSFFSTEQLRRSLSKKVMKKYDELQTALVLEKAGLDGLCKCPKCDFQASLPETEMVFDCPSCGFESCRKCGEPSHIPLRCEEVEKKTETSARLQIEEAMTQARIRHCPKGCKQGFYKVEGCNKMTCPQCKTFICYVCRAEIPRSVGYQHFCQKPHCNHKAGKCEGCPLYSNAEEDDARAAREAGLKAVQDLKGDAKTENAAEKMENILREEQRNSNDPNANSNVAMNNPIGVQVQPRIQAAQGGLRMQQMQQMQLQALANLPRADNDQDLFQNVFVPPYPPRRHDHMQLMNIPAPLNPPPQFGRRRVRAHRGRHRR